MDRVNGQLFVAGQVPRSLVIARSYDVGPVLVTCDEDNVPSARVIERCGGTMENVLDNPEGGPRKRRYRIV